MAEGDPEDHQERRMAYEACPTCGADPCMNPHFCAVCRKADLRRQHQRRQRPDDGLDGLRRLLDDSLSIESAWFALNGRRQRAEAAAATVDALMFSLRSRGVSALAEASVCQRLRELSDAQLVGVADRLQK